MSEQEIPGQPRMSLGSQYAQTAVVITAALLESLAGYKIIAIRFGATGFAQFSLAMRILALIHPALLLGTSVGLPRFVARLSPLERSQRAPRYLSAATRIVVAAVIAVGLPLAVFASKVAQVVGLRTRADVVRGVVVLLMGTCLTAVAYAHYRGIFRMASANTLFFVNFVVVPLIAALVGPSISLVIILTGAAMSVVSLFWLLPAGAQTGLRGRRELTELLDYGARRVPGELMLIGLLSIPPVVTSHTRGLIDAGVFAFGVSLLSAAGSLFGPVSMVLLPHASAAFARDESEMLVRHVRKLALRVFLLSVIASAIGIVAASLGLRLYLGSKHAHDVTALRFVAACVPPYVLYNVLRAIIDAYHFRAVNMRNGSIAFAAMILALAVGAAAHMSRAPELSLLIGMYLLGALTVFHMRRIPWRSTGSGEQDGALDL